MGAHHNSRTYSNRVSELGSNWFLNVGGSITRRVNGVEDELRDDRAPFQVTNDPNNGSQKANVDGFLEGIRKHKDKIFNYDLTPDHLNIKSPYPLGIILDRSSQNFVSAPFSFVSSSPNSSKKYFVAYSDDPFELSVDEFSFNFMGISGKFYINSSGNATVVSESNITVDITNLSPQRAEPGRRNQEAMIKQNLTIQKLQLR